MLDPFFSRLPPLELDSSARCLVLKERSGQVLLPLVGTMKSNGNFVMAVVMK